ncbi:hypothetical protein BD626DRAFT_498798 [Schizophyllum amplum]|uniref:Uncharacterized protein n=1 Tax=Schizophyllum amplum TaxID=97359 RepID=A0A550CC93_9AGAR|nr:hypothetical protein BD626DRAFT_498798 [Auriculariopsis ampla]
MEFYQGQWRPRPCLARPLNSRIAIAIVQGNAAVHHVPSARCSECLPNKTLRPGDALVLKPSRRATVCARPHCWLPLVRPFPSFVSRLRTTHATPEVFWPNLSSPITNDGTSRRTASGHRVRRITQPPAAGSSSDGGQAEVEPAHRSSPLVIRDDSGPSAEHRAYAEDHRSRRRAL